MSGTDVFKAYQQAYKKALEIHHKWEHGDEAKLLKQANELRDAIKPLVELVGKDWNRSQNLERHLNCVPYYLERNEKYAANSDINDLIYADLPALADELLKLA